MAEIADIFRRYGHEYLDRFGNTMLPSHRRAFGDIQQCRTEALGGHVAQCDHCAHLRYAYHSCKNRSCPKCQKTDQENWLEKRRQELLPVPYFHLVFTLPKELRSLLWSHQRILYAILIKAACHSLAKLATDPRYLGGRIGVVAVLHTWTRALLYHPHVHCLVPAGGLSADGKYWLPARNDFLVPVRALSLIFRAQFIELARKALPGVTFPETVWQTSWVVYCRPTPQRTQKVLDYLARYILRVAITNARILSVANGKISFRYKDSREHCWKTATLPASDFIHRFLRHVLPKRFHKVRYYGFLSPKNRYQLTQIKQALLPHAPDNEPRKTKDGGSNETAATYHHTYLCPLCLTGTLVLVSFLAPQRRAPPCKSHDVSLPKASSRRPS
jgi:hypothetical protein